MSSVEKCVHASILIISILIVCPEKVKAQVCADSGWYAGLDASNPGDSDVRDTPDTFILIDYGIITCYGVIADWTFFKSRECENILFQVWREEGNNYVLVGENLYDNVEENCQNVTGQETVFYVPAHKQIPVKPNDIIGWTQVDVSGNPSSDSMIRYLDNNNRTTVKIDCSSPKLDIGRNTTHCRQLSYSFKDFSLQAHIRKGLAPEIGNLPFTVEVDENQGALPDIYLVEASHEKNLVEDNIVWWNPTPVRLIFVSPNDAIFSVTTQTPPFGGDPIYTGAIETKGSLNYEEQQEYNVTVTVVGMDLQTKSILTVKVRDINEAHSIVNLEDEIAVSTKSPVGKEFFQVLVDDPDTINPSTIEYFLTSSDEIDPPPPFEIDQYTGIIRVKDDLTDWYQPKAYILVVTATDYMHSVTGNLTVNILYTKDLPMVSNLNERIDLPEDAPDGSDVFQVVVEPVGNLYLYSIVSVVPIEYLPKFAIAQDGWIYLTEDGDLDYYNPGNMISIVVQVCDGELCSNTNKSSTLTVVLTWVNEAPRFTPDVYFVEIPEMCGYYKDPQNCALSPWEIPDLTIEHYHRDRAPEDPATTCTILPSHGSDKFDITSNCQKLRMINPIDVNVDPTLMSINLTLKIHDSGPPVLSDTAQIFLTVYDINHYNPKLSKSSYEHTIFENTKGGVSLFTVLATDKDFGRNAEIVYTLDNIGPDCGKCYFQIHPETGVVYTKQPIDYEVLPEFNKKITFEVVASDRGIPEPRKATSTVTINIEDVNDLRPVYNCAFPRPYEEGFDPVDPNFDCFYNLDIRHDTLINHTLMEFFSTDEDSVTPNPQYSILNVEPHYRIENPGSTGVLYTNDQLYKYHMYALIVESKDQGTPELKARAPSVVRIDTFDAPEHLVDITLGYPVDTFNDSQIQMEFISIMRDFCDPWFIRLQRFGEERDSPNDASETTLVTIYALTDNSTFLHSNFDQEKHFVSLKDLLQKLRLDLKGTPRDELKDVAEKFNPIQVMPTYPKFLIHTLGGWITLLFLFLFFLVLLIGIILCLCRRFAVCCFRKKLPTKHGWMYDKRVKGENVYNEPYSTSSRRSSTSSRGTKSGLSTTSNSALSRKGQNSEDLYNSPSSQDDVYRRPSQNSIHSLIYDTRDRAALKKNASS